MIEEWNRPSAEYALRGALCASSPMAAKLRKGTERSQGGEPQLSCVVAADQFSINFIDLE